MAKANATAAAGIRVGGAGGGRGTVLGDTGQASMEQRITYSGPSESGDEEESSTSSSSSSRRSSGSSTSGGNRAERRRSKKKRRH